MGINRKILSGVREVIVCSAQTIVRILHCVLEERIIKGIEANEVSTQIRKFKMLEYLKFMSYETCIQIFNDLCGFKVYIFS